MLARLRKTQEENEGGFTLIELLVVVIIIGILAAIAIPTFLNQREKAWQKAAQSDLRNAATVMEEFFSDAGSYAATTGVSEPVFKTSDGVAVTYAAAALGRSTNGYCLNADHSKLGGGAGVDYHFKSTLGKPAVGACA
jgi:type IV pilus assembly protein PilA